MFAVSARFNAAVGHLLVFQMAQTFEPIETVAGIISGRDAIFLDDVQVSLSPHTIELRGELNSLLCSKFKGEDSFIKYSLKFSGVLAFAMTELDFKDHLGVSSFDRVVNSQWLDKMCRKDHSSKLKPNIEHYLVFTYDDVFDIACESYELKILEAREKQRGVGK